MCNQFDWFADLTAGMAIMALLKNPSQRFVNRTIDRSIDRNINDYLQSAIAGLTHSYCHSPNQLRYIRLRFA